MGTTRADLFTEEQNRLAVAAKALAHPARIAIIHQLVSARACINSDLVNELGLAQATISQHLRELKDAGIIQGTIEGTRMCYCIDPVKWSAIRQMLTDLFNQMDSAAGSGKDCFVARKEAKVEPQASATCQSREMLLTLPGRMDE